MTAQLIAVALLGLLFAWLDHRRQRQGTADWRVFCEEVNRWRLELDAAERTA